MLTEYDPTHEFAVVLQKPNDHASTYRVGTVPRSPQGVRANELLPCLPAEHTPEPELEPPDVKK
jgi:hypothetical protein